MPDEKLLDEVVKTERAVKRALVRRDIALARALDAGWTQLVLARELGITRQAVSARAKRARPTVSPTMSDPS